MKNVIMLIVGLMTILATPVQSQVISPEMQWEVSTPIGTAPANVNGFMDYTDDVCFSGYHTADFMRGFTSVQSTGVTNFVGDDLGDDYIYTDPFTTVNRGSFSQIYTFDSETGLLLLQSVDNATGIVYHNISWAIATNYTQSAVVDAAYIEAGDITYHGILLKTLDITDNKWKAICVMVTYHTTGDFATHEIVPIFIGSWATFPSSIIAEPGSPDHSFYIWGYFNRDAAGVNRDNFISRVHNDGEIFSAVYIKSHYSYTGRDDVGAMVVIDAAGNLFGISHSEDNVAPYYDHIAIFKINKANGKRIWLRRFGLDITGNEQCTGLEVFVGNGPIFAGTFSDGAGGLNSRVWRLDNSGNTMWIRTVNLTGPGSIEAVSAMGICPASGDVNIAGYRSTTSTYFMARYNATTGASVWPVEVYTGVHSGETTNGDMDIDFSLAGDIYLSYIVQSGATALQVVTKYEQVVLKDNAPYTAEQISLYPNPAHSFITISGVRGSGFMYVVDQQGQIVLEHNFVQDDPNLNVESLPTGLYTIVMQLEDLTEVFRFVKQ